MAADPKRKKPDIQPDRVFNDVPGAESRESERKYRTIFENTGTATILIEDDTTVSMMNTEFERLSGFSRAEVEGTKRWTSFIAPEDVDRMREYHLQRRTGERPAPRNYECTLITRGGERRACAMTVALIPGTRQSVASLLDITDQKKDAELLRESEERYRLLVETMNDGLGIQDENGIITYVNPRICEIMGYSREEIIGRPVTGLLREDYRRVWTEQMRHHERNRYLPYEVAWVSRDGRVIYTIVSPRPLYDGAGAYRGSFAIFTDITARKQAEDALRKSEEKFSKAFRASPIAVTISTRDEGRFVDVNDSFLRITGYTRDEVIDRTVFELGIWPDAAYRERLLAPIGDGGGVKDREVSFRVKSGELRLGIYSAEIIELSGVPFLLSIFADVTEERRLEREVLSIGEEERRRIGQDLHDDLQQHLIGIEALASSLAARLASQHPVEAGRAGEILELLRGAVEKTRRLARGLCPVYLDENGLAAALRDLAAGVGASFGISCEYRQDRSVTLEDNTTAIHLYHIAQEAVTNAVRHGGARHVMVLIEHRPAGVMMTVQDDGRGLPGGQPPRGGLGLRIMQYRARMIGAWLTVGNRDEGGVQVACQLKEG